jgi:hypothetical protein
LETQQPDRHERQPPPLTHPARYGTLVGDEESTC